MRVYRSASKEFPTNSLFPNRRENGIWYANIQNTKCIYQPEIGDVVHTGKEGEFTTFQTLAGYTIEHDKYYQLKSVNAYGNAVWEEVESNTVVVFDIMEATYSGQDMGKRSISATIKYPTPIDFRVGDYVEIPMQSLVRGDEKRGSVIYERFYIYNEPQRKKTARPMSTGDAFETTVTFYPRQHELSGVQMRDFLQQSGDGTPIMYTGFDEVTFYGGAYELLERCMACLAQQFVGNDGKPLWKYVLADSVNENKNNALERYALTFSHQSVMDALLKLNDKDGINTTFFINDRTIYVGFKRPYLCKVNSLGAIEDKPLKLMYGKTSDKAIDLDHGGLYDITKGVEEDRPVTKLFAYGAARNLNRYYCADRIQSGRFVNKLMLPSFSNDGKTDYILSEDGVKKYGIIEKSQNFEEIYPSLRYMTYADIRGIKYCIKVRTSGRLTDIFDNGDKMTHSNSNSVYPIARVQCYRVEGVLDENNNPTGVNTLVECAPPVDLAVYIHATGKTVKVRLYGGATKAEACQKQLAHDGMIPTTNGYAPANDWSNCYAGACFCVHDNGFPDANGDTWDNVERVKWFQNIRRVGETDPLYAETEEQQRAELHRIEYVDTFWLTDLYIFESYDQTSFARDGFSAWAWPRLNSASKFPDNLLVNEVVAVEPIVIPDTSENATNGRQQHWDIYLRDIGFAIDEQNDFGEMVFVYNQPVISVLDGTLSGREFTIDGGDSLNDHQDRIVCAYKPDGSFNNDFYVAGDSNDNSIAPKAFAQGAIWRIRLNRNESDDYLKSVGIVVPNTDIAMKAGDHIVLLDIYMPDIYVRAAENRLLQEARKFLSKNDKVNVKYSISFDKVRIQQIPNYALQMREGVQLRVVDDDLEVTSENMVRKLVDYGIPNLSNVPLFENFTDVETYETTITYDYYSETDPQGRIPKITDVIRIEDILEQEGYRYVYISIPKQDGAYACTNVRILVYSVVAGSKQILDREDRWLIKFKTSEPADRILRQGITLEVTESVSRATFTKDVKDSGEYVCAICKDYINFQSNKFYEVEVIVDNSYWDDDDDLWRGTINHQDIVLTPHVGDILEYFRPDNYQLVETAYDDTHTKLKYSFYLPDNFNDAVGYYVSLVYHGDSVSDYAQIAMVSVTEKDLDEDNQKVNYVDFIASNVTIKMTDNTRPASSRILQSYPEPIREIQAQIAEQTKATAWGQLNNAVQQNAETIDQMQKTYESFVQTSRINYQQLLNLKDAIFDPDGSCTNLFIQTMMLQVGADSMNYQLRKTLTSPTGVPSNYIVERKVSDTYDHFRVFEDDILDHFVYTKGAGNGGSWEIPGGFDTELAPVVNGNETTYPTYYVCIRCKRNSTNDLSEHAWICSTRQYAVNESTNPGEDAYWYFNWGILVADSNGNYTLTETRGNAYMYGDNIICGKISTLAGNSYFDLTHGNFVLSQNGPDAQDKYHEGLEYRNGVLTIHGLSSDSIQMIINKFFENGAMDTNLWCVDRNVSVSQSAGLGYIGGELTNKNLKMTLKVTTFDYDTDDDPWGTFNIRLYAILIDTNGGEHTDFYDLPDIDGVGDCSWTFNTSTIFLEDHPTWTIKSISVGCILSLTYGYDFYCVLEDGMVIDLGDRLTDYKASYQHVIDALKGSTEIAGGLTMTNVLMLKDESGIVKAGMSGLTDNNSNGEFGDGTFSEGVAFFSGGTYDEALIQAKGLYSQLRQLLPVLITKTGVHSKIGPFEVLSTTSVAVKTPNGRSIVIDTEKGISMLDENGITRFKLVMDDISISGIASYRGQFSFDSPIKYKTYNTSDSNVEVYLGMSYPQITTVGNYKIEAGDFAIFVLPYSIDRRYVRGTGYIENSAIIMDSISFTYEIYLENASSHTKYYLTGNSSSHQETTTISGTTQLDINAETNINNMEAGFYYMYIKFSSPYDFSNYDGHYYLFGIRYTPEIVGLDNVDFSGKVVIGNNGLLVAAGNSTYMMVGTDKESNKLDVRVLGLPKNGDGTQITSGRVYIEGSNNLAVMP